MHSPTIARYSRDEIGACRSECGGRRFQVVSRIDDIRWAVLADPKRKIHFERSIVRFCRVQDDAEPSITADELRDLLREEDTVHDEDGSDVPMPDPASLNDFRWMLYEVTNKLPTNK